MSSELLSHSSTGRLMTAIRNSGLLGITPKQLVSATMLPLPHVQEELVRLSSEKRIARIGRNLWVLSDYERNTQADTSFVGPQWYMERFEEAFQLKGGRYERDMRFNPNEKLPVHRWWPYIQGFSADFVRETCMEYGTTSGSTVLDPFAGSGTVPVVARLMGAASVGIELMPIAAFVARGKQNWDVDVDSLLSAARDVVENRGGFLRTAPPFLKETSRQFPPEVLSALLRLKENIWALPQTPHREALKLCFASILIGSSNLKRSPCLGYAPRPLLGPSTPSRLFKEAVSRMVTDLAWLGFRRARWGPEARIVEGNSKEVRLPPGSVDLAITSPPYVNGLDYVMNYKIELSWLDFARSYEDLSRLKSAMVACDNVSRTLIEGHRSGPLVEGDAWLRDVLSQIQRNITAKAHYRRGDMPGIIAKYFDDLCPVIQNVYDALKPGARFVVVNGDSFMAGAYLPGDLIFGRLGKAIGFEVEKFEIARKRRSGQRRSFLLRESILTLRKPGPSRRRVGKTRMETLDPLQPSS